MLHVHSGDTSANALRMAKVPGEVMVWSDPLMEGPLPYELSAAAWREARAHHLSQSTKGALPAEQVVERLAAQDAALEKFRDHDEVVMWFDACLFDQLILLRHLDWFSRQDPGPARLSLICVGEYPGFTKFNGLGELLPHQLAGLLDRRHAVTPAETDLARRAWKAFRSASPRDIGKLLATDTSALPYLADALRRHLEQFPSVRNGLNRLENEALAVIANGYEKLVTIFVHVDMREPRPFYGDTALWACLDRMATAKKPAIEVDGPGPLPLWNPPRKLTDWTLRATDVGHELLAGKKDWIRLNGVERRLGGVHLQGATAAWRWDEARRELVAAAKPRKRRPAAKKQRRR